MLPTTIVIIIVIVITNNKLNHFAFSLIMNTTKYAMNAAMD